MQYRDFKGNQISKLGFGVMRLPTDPDNPGTFDREAGQKIIDRAMELGINYFDTAHIYQKTDSEKFLGEALKKYPRDSYYLATKFYGSPKRDIRKTFFEQLERLQTDYMDFYLLHCLEEDTFALYTDPERDYLGFLRQMRAEGRIRYLGFSTHASPEMLEKFLAYDDGFDMALMQLNFVDWDLLDAKGQYEILTKHNIPVWVMEPLKGGRLATLNESACKILKSTASERSIPSWGFRWLMGLPNVHTVLSGMGSVEMAEENGALFHECKPLDAAELQILEQARAAFIHELGVPCSGCRYCCDECPEGLDIPLLIRYFNEKSLGGEAWKIPGLDKAKSADACLQCGACMAHCHQKIKIPEIMAKLQKKE